jgi:CrcB protein
MPDARIIKTYFVVAIGGGIGAAARFWLGNLGSTLIYGTFPWGIMTVNMLGCFIIGFFSEATGNSGMLSVSADSRSFVMIGFCGGFTTFSSFSLGTLALLQQGQLFAAFSNVALSVTGCLAAVTAGVWLIRFTNLSTQNVEDRRI